MTESNKHWPWLLSAAVSESTLRHDTDGINEDSRGKHPKNLNPVQLIIALFVNTGRKRCKLEVSPTHGGAQLLNITHPSLWWMLAVTFFVPLGIFE